ncbi:FAD-binding domain-containing protein [Glonium stellatum]|uniref:FAD-binding domain-containing protein n=1 Tax=Glonium stellatum TaxID=574774 RepID=A0A8E2JTB0_9PEZI|nr:FAD-binding domain-containing protein [Glonium stellatum]
MAPSLAQLLSLLPPLLLLSPARALTLRSDASSSLPTLKHELRGASACRCFPGDPCWPTPAQWKAFNSTLGGKLIVTVQLLHPKCDALQNIWFNPQTHIDSPSSVMAQYFTNNSCNPFLPDSASLNASSASDYQKTIAFIQQHNIRLVIKNTGHDYNGKSTGAGAVAIWTHNIKLMEAIDYHSSYYTGKVMKMGAGVAVHEAYEFADTKDVLVVGGNCPTVGLVGGYTQGGGHGPLASKFGLGADQVLEWEVVTGTGQLVTATPTQYLDLYWALCGGGGGIYGAVVSLTAKAYPAVAVAAANMTFFNNGSNADQFYDVIATFQESLPAMVDAGVVVIWLLTPTYFALMPATAPGLSKASLDALWKPTIDKLNEHQIQYQYYSQEFPTYLESYKAMNTPWEVSENQVGGRLIPRSLVEKNNTALMSALRNLVDGGTLFSGVAFNVNHSVSSPDAVAANPYWRELIFDAVLGTPYSYTDWNANVQYALEMTNDLLPQLEKLMPNGGAYLNEADFRQPDFQSVFYGSNYGKLNAIKAKYNPEDRFYALTAVGSDRWTQRQDGRLCRT